MAREKLENSIQADLVKSLVVVRVSPERVYVFEEITEEYLLLSNAFDKYHRAAFELGENLVRLAHRLEATSRPHRDWHINIANVIGGAQHH